MHPEAPRQTEDLLIDRSDDVIDVCEMKYYAKEYAFTKEEYNKLQNRMLRLAEETKTRKAVQASLRTFQSTLVYIRQTCRKLTDSPRFLHILS